VLSDKYTTVKCPVQYSVCCQINTLQCIVCCQRNTLQYSVCCQRNTLQYSFQSTTV